jgi:hypothetical protein
MTEIAVNLRLINVWSNPPIHLVYDIRLVLRPVFLYTQSSMSHKRNPEDKNRVPARIVAFRCFPDPIRPSRPNPFTQTRPAEPIRYP